MPTMIPGPPALCGRVTRRALALRMAFTLAFALALTMAAVLAGPLARPALAAVPAPGPTAANAPTLVVLGDSISAGYGIPVAQGWVALLGGRLADQGYGYRVVNASVSGETTAGALARLPHVLALNAPALVLIELGGNDGLRGLPIEQTLSNLESIVARVQDSGAIAVVIGMRMPPNYGPTYTERFAALYGEVAARRHAPLVPFLLARVAADDANFQADRIHPVAAAQPALLDAVWPVLEPLLRRHGAKPARG